MIIPLKKLLQTDPPGLQSMTPGQTPGDYICTAAEHEAGGKVYAEFAFYNYTDSDPVIRCFCAVDNDGRTRVRKWCESGEFSADIYGKLYPRWWEKTNISDSEYASEIAKKWLRCDGLPPSCQWGNLKISVAEQLDSINAARRICEHEEKEKKNRLEADSYMSQVPEICVNEELIQWIRRNVVRENFLFLFSRKYRDPMTGLGYTEKLCQCSVCGAESLRDMTMRHGEHVYCPECLAPVTCYDAGRSRQYLTRSGVFKIISRIGKEGFCLRTFRIIADFTSCDPRDPLFPSEAVLKMSEETRHVYDVDGGKFIRYENRGNHWHKMQHDFFSNGGKQACTNIGYGCYTISEQRMISHLWLNEELSADALANSRLRYIDWHKALNGIAESNIPVKDQVDVLEIYLEELLYNFIKYPIYELFAKAGAYHLFNTRECLLSNFFNTNRPNESEILQSMPKNILFELLRRNVKYEELHSVIKAHGFMPKWNADELLAVARLLRECSVDDNNEVFKLKHLSKLPKMIIKYHYDPIIYRDYLRDCRKLNYDLTREDVEFPYDLIQAHADANKQIIIKKNQKLISKIADAAEKAKVYEWANDHFLIRPALSIEDLISEGSQQNNCVARNYTESYADGRCVILFARRTDDPDKSYITIELKDNKVVQARLAHNANLDTDASALMQIYDRMILAPIRARNEKIKKSKKKKERVAV